MIMIDLNKTRKVDQNKIPSKKDPYVDNRWKALKLCTRGILLWIIAINYNSSFLIGQSASVRLKEIPLWALVLNALKSLWISCKRFGGTDKLIINVPGPFFALLFRDISTLYNFTFFLIFSPALWDIVHNSVWIIARPTFTDIFSPTDFRTRQVAVLQQQKHEIKSDKK